MRSRWVLIVMLSHLLLEYLSIPVLAKGGLGDRRMLMDCLVQDLLASTVERGIKGIIIGSMLE